MRTLLALLCGPLAFAADLSKFTTPEPKNLPADLRVPGPADKLYPIPQNLEQSAKQHAVSRKWYRSQLLDPFLNGPNANAKWAAKTKEALDATAIYYHALRIFPKRTAYLDRSSYPLADAVKAGCDDPIVRFFDLKQFNRLKTPEEKAGGYKKILDQLEKTKAPPYIRAVVSLDYATSYYLAEKNAGTPKGTKGRTYFEKTMLCLGEMAKDPNPAAQDAVLYLAKHLMIYYRDTGWGRETCFNDLMEVLPDAGASKAFLHTLKGEYLVEHAFDARGRGTAETLTRDGHSLFRERLQQAQVEYEAAWAADEKQDAAAAGMITVCMGLQHKRDVMEKWFQRAMTANPDSYRACGAKHLYLLPKWGGKVEDTLAFGRQCLRTSNYYSGIPYLIVVGHRSMNDPNLLKFSEHLGQDPAAWADVREFYENALQRWTKDRELRTEYAVWCAGAGEWKAAKLHMDLLNNNPIKGVFYEQRDFEIFKKQVNEKVKELK